MRYYNLTIKTEHGDYSVVAPESEVLELLGMLMLDGSEGKITLLDYELEEVFFNESAVNLG